MCEQNEFAPLTDPEYLDDMLELWKEDLQAASDLSLVLSSLPPRDEAFARSLLSQLMAEGNLSSRQWPWVNTLLQRVRGAEPIYGSFDPILVMFRLASAAGRLKRPKIRLLSAEDTFVQLTFFPLRESEAEASDRVIEIHTGGWAGHGRRKFAGWVLADRLIPYQPDRLSPDVKNVIQDLALDPLGCAKAMAAKLGACMYCGSRLTDEPSKEAGYGPVCAENYGLPWGQISLEDRERENASRGRASKISTMDDLGALF